MPHDNVADQPLWPGASRRVDGPDKLTTGRWRVFRGDKESRSNIETLKAA
jgi:hypothetical protein